MSDIRESTTYQRPKHIRLPPVDLEYLGMGPAWSKDNPPPESDEDGLTIDLTDALENGSCDARPTPDDPATK